jgi:biotin synthase-like enzyme
MAEAFSREAIAELFALPFLDLVSRAHDVHVRHHPRNAVQLSTLLSIKTGGCVEDCGYCSQSVYDDNYNHNIDTSPENYANVITTRSFADRLDTLDRVRAAGMAVCCGGILGMGESRDDRVGFLHALANLRTPPESVPLNALVPIAGTVLGDLLKDVPQARIDDIEFVRTVAVARITMPNSIVRLSAGRESMSDSTQALCFLAGANSIFTGDRLLTTDNAGGSADKVLFDKLGLSSMTRLAEAGNHTIAAE